MRTNHLKRYSSFSKKMQKNAHALGLMRLAGEGSTQQVQELGPVHIGDETKNTAPGNAVTDNVSSLRQTLTRCPALAIAKNRS